MKRFMMILGILLVFLVQVALSYLIMDHFFSGAPQGEEHPAEEVVQKEERKEKGPRPEVDYEFGATHNIEGLILNPRGGRRIFKISLALEYDPEKSGIGDELVAKDLFLRDFLLDYLSNVHADTLGDIRFRNALRDSLAYRLSGFLDEGYVDRVLFIDFIRQ